MTGTYAYIIHPAFKKKSVSDLRDPEACLEEAIGLAQAIDLQVMGSAIVTIVAPKPATLMGSGKVEELKTHIDACEAQLVVVNDSLSPVQQRNLEKAWGCKVIDRTALILEIFGARARTHEGKLQVELAALNYQKSRLVRSWTHLERQRGGFGFLGGPGESQIEIDRRLIRDRIAKIRLQLSQVTRTRELHRKVRRDTPYPVVALVGYTNAGKSTLFNRMTGAKVLAMDALFATLDPTMRAMRLPSGQQIILSDTVGFISNLPTELIAAFRATLEEVMEADVVLHIRDASHADMEAQKQDVEHVLKDLYGVSSMPEHLIEVYNKMDRLEPSFIDGLTQRGMIAISAQTGAGIDSVCSAIDTQLMKRHTQQADFMMSMASGKALAWLHAHGSIVSQVMVDERMSVTVRLSHEHMARFRQQFADQLY